MTTERTRSVLVARVAGCEPSARPDTLIVEEPMTIQLDGVRVTTTMRTPGHDHELAAGFCFGEGVLGGAEILGVRHCINDTASGAEVDPNVVTVDTGCLAPPPTPRLGNVSSSCGWCGADQLDELCDRLAPLVDSTTIPLDVLAAVPDRATSAQPLFAETGAVHGAAAFDPAGQVIVACEDVGRHNAVDKVVGSLLLGRVDGRAAGAAAPGTGLGLYVSGRASIEMVQKAWAAGFGSLVSVSAPTSLAVDAARRANLVLAGFVRDREFNLYSPAPDE